MIFKIIVVSLLSLILRDTYKIRFVRIDNKLYIVYQNYITDGIEWWRENKKILIFKFTKNLKDDGGRFPF